MASSKHGAEAKYPANWLDGIGTRTEKDSRFQTQYNAQLFAILAEKLLIVEGVNILYGTYVVATDIENGRICHIITEGKSGREAYRDFLQKREQDSQRWPTTIATYKTVSFCMRAILCNQKEQDHMILLFLISRNTSSGGVS